MRVIGIYNSATNTPPAISSKLQAKVDACGGQYCFSTFNLSDATNEAVKLKQYIYSELSNYFEPEMGEEMPFDDFSDTLDDS